jgi:hypothetical protein
LGTADILFCFRRLNKTLFQFAASSILRRHRSKQSPTVQQRMVPFLKSTLTSPRIRSRENTKLGYEQRHICATKRAFPIRKSNLSTNTTTTTTPELCSSVSETPRDHHCRQTFIHYSNNLNEDAYHSELPVRGLTVQHPFTLFPFLLRLTSTERISNPFPNNLISGFRSLRCGSSAETLFLSKAAPPMHVCMLTSPHTRD